METVEIAAQTGAVVTLEPGQLLTVVDVEGCQVADMFAVSTDDDREWLSTTATRTATERLFPMVGQSFLSVSYRPLLTFERDDSPGMHDMLAAPCSPRMYELLEHGGHHRSCTENFRSSAERVGWHPADVPDSVNFFQHSTVGADGVLTHLPAKTVAGDSVTLRAQTRVHVVVTACPMDLGPINGESCTPLRLVVQP